MVNSNLNTKACLALLLKDDISGVSIEHPRNSMTTLYYGLLELKYLPALWEQWSLLCLQVFSYSLTSFMEFYSMHVQLSIHQQTLG